MSTENSLPIDDQHLPSPYPPINRPEDISPTTNNRPLPVNKWTDRMKIYFLTTEGRIALARILTALICVVLQHTMGTCVHHISNATSFAEWHIFTPPFGAGPHTATFFFVLSWTTLAYCLERVWLFVTLGTRFSKTRDMIVHAIMVLLYLAALAFNIWGYVLCESSSQISDSKKFAPGVCRGESQACILLIAGVLAACAAVFAFFTEHILALVSVLRQRSEPKNQV